MTRKRARTASVARLGGCLLAITLGTSVSWSSCSVYDEGLLVNSPDSSAGSNGASGSFGSSGTDGVGGGDDGGVGGTGGTDGVGGSSGSAGTGDGAACPTTSGPWWGAVNSYGCQTTGVPKPEDRPPAACEGASLPAIIFANSRIRLGTAKDDVQLTLDDTAWKEIGLDIDNSCTKSETCWVPPDGGSADAGDAGDGGPRGPLVDEKACKPGVVDPFDGSQCRDNALGEIMFFAANSPDIGAKLGINEAHWNCALHRGEFGIIIKVSDYNGTPDDPQVRVDIYTSLGQQNKPGWSCMENGVLRTNWQTHPLWDPTTHWKIARRSLALNDTGTGTELPRARAADPIAYVRGGYLVAKLPAGTELWLNGNHPDAHVAGFRNVIYRATTVAKLTEGANNVWSMDQGIIAGVTFPTDVVLALREVGFCENFCGSYDQLKSVVNIAQDSLTATSEPQPGFDCDGISMGIAFSARQVRAERADLVDSDPVVCPNPKDPTLPRQGCVCQPGGGCIPKDGGADGG